MIFRPRFLGTEETVRSNSCGNPIAPCAIPHSHEQSLHADVFVQFVPMDACPVAGKLVLLALLRCGRQQTWEIG